MNDWDPQQNLNRQEISNAANKIATNISAENYENRRNLLKIEIAKAQDRTTKAELQQILNEMEEEVAKRKARNRIVSAILIVVIIIISALFFPFIKNKIDASHNPQKIDKIGASLSSHYSENVSTSNSTSIESAQSTSTNTVSSTSQQQSVKSDVIDTKNLTSEQLKEWISAVLNAEGVINNFRIDVTTKDGYAYATVTNTDAQVDSVGSYRVNDKGELEEDGYYYGEIGSWIVVSPSFMDTTHIPVIESSSSITDDNSNQNQSSNISDHDRAEDVRLLMITNQNLDPNILANIPDDEILALNAGNATNADIAQTAQNLINRYPVLKDAHSK